jgi:hypothetical protein
MLIPIFAIGQTYIPSGGLEILNNLGQTVISLFDTGDAEFDGTITATAFVGDGSALTGVGITPEFIEALDPASPAALDLLVGVDATDGALKQYDIGDILGAGGGITDGATLVTGLTFPNTGLHLLDTNASHDLILSPGSDLTADRTLTIMTADLNRTLTLSGDSTISGANSGDITLSGTPDYLSLTNQVLTLNGIDMNDIDATGTPSASTYLRGDGSWAAVSGSGITDGDTLTTGLTFPNTGLKALDTDASHALTLRYNENASAARTLNLVLGNTDRTLTLSADATVGGTNSGDVTLSGTPDYLSLTNQVLTLNTVDMNDIDATGTPSASTYLRGDGSWTALVGGDPTYGSAGGATDNAVYVDADNQLGLGILAPLSSIHIYDETLPPTITYQYFNESVGDVTQYAGTGTGMADGAGGTWNNPSNISANDGNFTQTINLFTDDSESNSFKATNFSFAIPAEAVIDGVEVDVEVWSSEADTEDYVTKLIIGGVVQEANKATGALLGTTPAVKTYGGPADTWSESLTPAIINSSDFGVSWQGWYGVAANISIDYITITIYYTTTAGDHTWATGLSLADGSFNFRENAIDHFSIAKTTGNATFQGNVTADAFIGDGSGLTGLPAPTIADGSISRAKLADMVADRIMGRNGTTGAPEDLTPAEVRTMLNVADGATANAGTVTSVGIIGTDGIDVDSGSPVTSSGSITLGLNSNTIWTNLVSTASTVTPGTEDSLLIADESALGAVAEVSLTNFVLTGTGNDNYLYKKNGTSGQFDRTDIIVDDSNNVTGLGTINGHTLPTGTYTLATTSKAEVLTNKEVVKREYVTNGSSATVDIDSYDQMTITGVSSSPITIGAPTGTKYNGQELIIWINQNATPAVFNFNAVFVSSAEWGLSGAIPAPSTTNDAWDYYKFVWNEYELQWHLLAHSAGN